MSSFAGGVAIAFVLLQLLVELVAHVSEELHAALPLGAEPLHTLVLVVLAGMTAFCIAHAYASRGPESNRTYAALAIPYAIYSMLVGAALVEEIHHGPKAFALYVLAMALHLAVSDQHLGAHFPLEHQGVVRGLVTSAPFLGAVGWVVLAPPAPVFDVTLALVAGATLLNAIREELPAPAYMRSWAFLAGVLIYGALIEVRVRL
ncbi:MAG: hypothetical protein ACXVEF_40880 [Polyangiales bacterium]